MVGRIIKILSNTYLVKSKEKIYNCTARGRIKLEDIKPVVRG